MMNRICFAMTVATSLCALTACPPPKVTKPPPVQNDESCVVDTNFANRDPSTAQPITPGTPVQGFLCPAFDDDGYKIHVDTAGSILVVTLAMPQGAITNVHPGYSISKIGADGKATAIVSIQGDPNQSPGHATNFTEANRIDDPGDYVVDVADVEGLENGFDTVNQYTLTVELQTDPDANEPNNLPTQATPITSGTPINGQIATTGDQDWYSIDLTAETAQQIVDAKLSVPANSGVTHVATLYAHDGTTVLQTVTLTADVTDPTKETARIRSAVPQSIASTGTVLLEVADGGGALGSQLDPAKGQYTIDLTVLPDPDANEGANGNSSTATATAVTSGTTLNASIASLADTDVYKVTPPGGTSVNAPQVLVVTVTFDAAQTIDDVFKPQVRVVGADPSNVKACSGGPNQDPSQQCTECYAGPGGNTCAEDRLQRFIKPGGFAVGFPLRNTEPVFVELSAFNDNAFQDNNLGYSIQFEVVADPDPGEKGDDFLEQDLEFAGFTDANRGSFQFDHANPRHVGLGYNPVCAAGANDGNGAGGAADACIDTQNVSNPVGFNFPATQLDCSDVPSKQVTLTGKLTYDGDRDYFQLDSFPDPASYMNMNIAYNVSAATPVELTIFVHAGGFRSLAGSFLDGLAPQNGCSEAQGGQLACAPGTLCVDSQCWPDGDNNPAVSDTFGTRPDECIEVGPNIGGDPSPVIIEVVDNGLNDFDLNMTYTLTVNIQCGCPSQCDSAQDFCQNG